MTSAKSMLLLLDGVTAKVLLEIASDPLYLYSQKVDEGSSPDTRIGALDVLLYSIGVWARPVFQNNGL